MEHKWTALALIAVVTIMGGNAAYEKYLKNELQMAKIQHG